MLSVFLATPASEREPEAFQLIRASRTAMATRFEIALPFGTPHALDAAEAALDLIDELEDQLSIYREHSEVSRLNSEGFSGTVVEESLFSLLARCAAITQETVGAFDVACGALVKAWGFHRREGRLPTPREQGAALAASGIKHVILDRGRVKFLRRGLEINLGSIGKGYALDRAAAVLKNDFGIESALLQAGGSSMLAIGTPPGDPRGWPVCISHPEKPDRVLATLRLTDRALATTAATYQFFEYNGRKYGHAIDPRTGWPVEGTASASALASDAATADALSTALFVMGLDAANAWLAKRDSIGAVILPAAGNVATLNLRNSP